jgi:hypothetical protein
LAFLLLEVLKMTNSTKKPLFSLGDIVATPGAVEALTANNILPFTLLQRHATGDWGNVCEEDAQSNNDAVQHDNRILSSYLVGSSTKIWLITEWDRSVTTILLPSEY